jgi:hypothetical protein
MNQINKAKILALTLTSLFVFAASAADQGMMGGPGHSKQDHGNAMSHMSKMMQDMSSHMANMSKMMMQGNISAEQHKNMSGMMEMMSMMMKDMSGMMGKGMVMDDAMQQRMNQMHQQMEGMNKGMMK